MSTIAKRFNVTVPELLEMNALEDVKSIKPGQFLRIPYRGQKLNKEDQALLSKGLIQRPAPSESSIKTVKLSGAKKYIGKLHWPVQGEGTISSTFGKRWTSFHEGIDISAEEGREIIAAHDGQVVYSGSGLKGYGNLVVIKAPGLLTVYGHNRKNRVRVGEWVKRGDHIADLGSTGKSTGPHLHFETRIKADDSRNIAVDPMAFYP